MNRLIAVVSFAALATPALATPFEQTELDRQLPAITLSTPASVYLSDSSAPFEQTELDRSLPAVEERVRYATAAGSTISDRSIATDIDSANVWTNDHNVISPAQ